MKKSFNPIPRECLRGFEILDLGEHTLKSKAFYHLRQTLEVVLEYIFVGNGFWLKIIYIVEREYGKIYCIPTKVCKNCIGKY